VVHAALWRWQMVSCRGADMLNVVRFVACAVAALAMAGCDPALERRYITEGAGVDFYTPDRAVQAELLNQYVDFICAQVGPGCGNVNWAGFVMAGMNDIDLRCDGFLTWLDARRRDREPILAEISAINTAVHAVMTVTGSNPKSLDIVTAAFGLASASYTNWNSRLLISINQSTVQEVVYKSQWQYREKIKTFLIPDQPTAIYLLRNYLRLCMPTTIEAAINTTTTLVQRDAAATATRSLVVSTTTSAMSAQTARVFRESIPSSPREPLRGAGKKNQDLVQVEPKMAGATNTERAIPQFDGIIIQANLCIKSPTTNFDLARDEIQQAKIGSSQSRRPLFANTDNRILNAAEAEIFKKTTSPPCVSSPSDVGHQTAYEKFRFPDEGAVTFLQQILKVCDGRLAISGKFDAATRDAIAVAKQQIDQTLRAGLTDLNVKTLRANSFLAIQRTCV
jgi:hypothetical protein